MLTRILSSLGIAWLSSAPAIRLVPSLLSPADSPSPLPAALPSSAFAAAVYAFGPVSPGHAALLALRERPVHRAQRDGAVRTHRSRRCAMWDWRDHQPLPNLIRIVVSFVPHGHHHLSNLSISHLFSPTRSPQYDMAHGVHPDRCHSCIRISRLPTASALFFWLCVTGCVLRALRGRAAVLRALHEQFCEDVLRSVDYRQPERERECMLSALCSPLGRIWLDMGRAFERQVRPEARRTGRKALAKTVWIRPSGGRHLQPSVL